MRTVIGIATEKCTGFAISDLSGRIINLFTLRKFKMDKLSEYLLSFGKPCAIAIDKEKVPKLAKELARKFDVPILAPKSDIPESEKRALTIDYSYKNYYERDALSAILYVFQKYDKIFREIEEIMKNMGFEKYIERAKEIVLREGVSTPFQAVENALSFLERKEKNEKFNLLEASEYKKKYEKAVDYIKKLEKKIRELEEENKILLKKTSEKPKDLLERIKDLERRIVFLKGELEREKELRKRIEEKLNVIQEERYIEKKGLIPAVRIKKFSLEYLSPLKNAVRIFRRPVVIEKDANDGKAAKYLAKSQPLIVIGDFSEKVKSILLKEKIPFISRKDVKGKMILFNRFYGIQPGVLEEAIETWKKKGFFEWLSMYKKRLL